MAKSPINILQEILIKERCVPQYIFLVGDNNGHFICRVTCKNLSIDGSGANKKEAKHNAAMNMLSALNETKGISSNGEGKTNYEIHDSTANEMKIHKKTYEHPQNDMHINSSLMLPSSTYNYVGLLQELCMQRKLPLPSYEEIKSIDINSINNFTIKGNVAFIQAIGSGYCKKAAKQEAAKNLLLSLKASNVFSAESLKKVEDTMPIDVEISNKIQSLYTAIKNNTGVQNIAITNNTGIQNFAIMNNTGVQNFAIMNSHTEISPITTPLKNQDQIVLDDDFCQLSVEISELSVNEPTLPPSTPQPKKTMPLPLEITPISKDISKNTMPLALEITPISKDISKNTMPLPLEITPISKDISKNTENYTLNDCHILFKEIYSNKISTDLRDRMRTACKHDIDEHIIRKLSEDIQTALGVQIKRSQYASQEAGTIVICLRMVSRPIITQFGLGKTVYEAETRALHAIINTITDFII